MALCSKSLLCTFVVLGTPVPKQSFRYTPNGGGFTDPRVKGWQQIVATHARAAMEGEPVTGPVRVELLFHLPTRRRCDLDNLSKGVLDALKKVVFVDDTQVVELVLKKIINPCAPGVAVSVEEVRGG